MIYTYVVCPRGTENYSFRIYEALGRGKIPVIIDTDMVLPKEIDWDHLSIRIPYESLVVVQFESQPTRALGRPMAYCHDDSQTP
jgi:hypothetical protein